MRNSVGPSVGRSPNEIVCGLPRVSETGSRPIQRAEATGDGRCHFDFPYRARRRRAGAWAASGAVLVIPCVIVGRCRKGGRGRRKALEGEGQVAFLKFRITSDVSIIPHLFVTQLGRWAGRRRRRLRRRPVVISLSLSVMKSDYGQGRKREGGERSFNLLLLLLPPPRRRAPAFARPIFRLVTNDRRTDGRERR